jgi:hypothetical protein
MYTCIAGYRYAARISSCALTALLLLVSWRGHRPKKRLEIEQSPAFPVIVQLDKVAICIIHYSVSHGYGIQNPTWNLHTVFFTNRLIEIYKISALPKKVGTLLYCDMLRDTLSANKETN